MNINWHEIKLKNKVLVEFISENFLIVIILFLFALLGFWIWQTSTNFKDFGENFVSEMLGVLITILIINQLIVLKEEKRKIPHKFVVYEDLRSFLSNLLLFWKKAYKASVPEDEPENIHIFFSENGIGKIWHYLYIKAQFKDNPAQNWAEYITEKSIELQQQAEKILLRHSQNLPPYIYRMIHSLIESRFLLVLTKIPSTLNYLEKNNNPRTNTLDAVAMVQPTDREYSSMIALFDWCGSLYDELKILDKSIDKLIEYKSRKMKNIPYAMITDSITEIENKKWEHYINELNK